MGGGGDEAAGDDAGLEDLAGTVDVGQQGLQREHPLADAVLDRHPVSGRDDPGRPTVPFDEGWVG